MELQSRLYNRYTKEEYLFSIGAVTDDTEMMLCLLSSIIESDGKYNKELTIQKYLEWGASKCRCYGKNTRVMLVSNNGKSLGPRAYANEVSICKRSEHMQIELKR